MDIEIVSCPWSNQPIVRQAITLSCRSIHHACSQDKQAECRIPNHRGIYIYIHWHIHMIMYMYIYIYRDIHTHTCLYIYIYMSYMIMIWYILGHTLCIYLLIYITGCLRCLRLRWRLRREASSADISARRTDLRRLAELRSLHMAIAIVICPLHRWFSKVMFVITRRFHHWWCSKFLLSLSRKPQLWKL